MEWFLVGVDLPKEKAYTQNLTLTIRGIIGLNGDIFKCRVTDVEGKQYEKSVTIRVKGKFVCFVIVATCAKNYGIKKWADDISPQTTLRISYQCFLIYVLLDASFSIDNQYHV